MPGFTTNSIGAALRDSCQKHADRVALKYKIDGKYQSITYQELSGRAIRLAAKLSELGIQKGDKIGLLSDNRPEWVIVDFASLAIGAVLVPVYTSLSAAQSRYIMQDSGAAYLFVDGDRQAAKVIDLKTEGEVKEIWQFDASDNKSCATASFDDLMQDTAQYDNAKLQKVDAIIDSIGRDDLATLIYTSGTTGLPKGVMLTHGNLLSNREGHLEILALTPDDTVLSLLPLAHVFERNAGYYAPILGGSTIAYAESPLTVADNMLEIHPTLMVAVPRFYEKVMQRILNAVRKYPPVRRYIFNWALRTGSRAAKTENKDNWRYRTADKLVFSKLRERVGGKIRFFVSGGAPLPLDVGKFFESAGIHIIEGYGLTETSPVLAVNRIDNYRFGTVGHPLHNVELKIAEDGEILAKGPNIMKGYLNLPGDTKAAFDAEGWLLTGDLGSFDEDGFLIITGRKKELIVTSSGRNIAPAPIENMLKSSVYIAEIMLIGDNKPFITALIVPDFEHLSTEGIGETEADGDRQKLVESKQVKRLFAYEIARLSGGLAEYEKIGRFKL
ncbi:long-chain fatty acid--CoA ligase, partial [bacterium]|nr:long-chain fatty acid--CoA ligase [bacterium]